MIDRKALLGSGLGLLACLGCFASGDSDLDERFPVRSGGSLLVDLELGEGLSFDRGALEITSHSLPEVRVVAETSGWGEYAVKLDLSADGDVVRLVGRVKGFGYWLFGGPNVSVKAWVPQDFTVDASIVGAPLRLEDLVGPVTARVGGEVILLGAEGDVKVVSKGGPISIEDVAGKLEVENRDGSISIAGVEGEVSAYSHNGSIWIEAVTGKVEARNGRGPIEMERVDGEIRARTDRGSIELEDVEGDVRLETDRGRIEVEEVEGKVEARSGRGGIEVEFVGNPSGKIETVRGSIDVEIPENASFDLDAATDRGHVELDGDFGDDGDYDDEHDHRDDDGRHRSLVLSVNGGGDKLELRTQRGSIRIEDR